MLTSSSTFTGTQFCAQLKWYNELGSEMIIESFDETIGVFTGQYNSASAVGEATKSYLLVGRKDTDGVTLGWTVSIIMSIA